MRFAVGGDAEHYNCRRKRCLSAAVGTCAALHDTARVYAGIFFFCSAHAATARYRAFTAVRGDTALYSF